MVTSKKILKAIFQGLINFFKDNGVMLAGSLTFFSVMAVIPFSMLILTAINYFFGAEEDFLVFFVSKLRNFFPSITETVTERIIIILKNTGIEKVTLILYIFQSFQFYLCLEFAFNTIFRKRGGRKLWVSFILSNFLITLIILMLITSFVMSSIISILPQYLEVHILHQFSKFSGFFIGMIIPIVLVFVAVTTLYLVVPRHRVRIKSALIGALITTLLLEIARYLFTFIIKEVVDLGVVYGSLSAVIAFLLWIFYSWCIFLLGAQVAKTLE
ncbi:MAG: YihY/virulence factor BrkB family protein [Thermodesulfovibrionales bacterium]|nr:YihY/virulence factor BrkB family protein [Thermodesulfovibrionales bacterium]